jgi:hypothetical protein
MQYENHPLTGEPLISEDIIKQAIEHKSISQYAYICHDKDVFSERDEVDSDGKYTAGKTKPRHWHIVIKVSYAIDTAVIAKWFSIPENFVDCPKGQGAFLDCCEYLTHEDEKQQKLGKRRYEDDEVVASFPFREELTKREEKRAKYGKDLSEKDEIRNKVLYEGLTLRQLAVENPLAYQNDYSTLDKFRMKYISERAPMPKTRLNYYVCGNGGIGKGLICRAIARSLYPNLQDDDDIFFEVGAPGAAFEGYDGQPVIIWNDRRAYDLLQELNGRGNVFNVFDTHPARGKQNVKYSSVNLINEVNIVNSVQDYSEFLDGLAGEYADKDGNINKVEDKGQAYRRFPFIIPLHEKDFDLLMNKGFYNGTKEYDQYVTYNHIRGNMQKIAEACGSDDGLAKQIQINAVKPITDKHIEVKAKMEHEAPDEAAIRAMFADYGTQAPEDRIPKIISIDKDKQQGQQGQQGQQEQLSFGNIDINNAFEDFK